VENDALIYHTFGPHGWIEVVRNLEENGENLQRHSLQKLKNFSSHSCDLDGFRLLTTFLKFCRKDFPKLFLFLLSFILHSTHYESDVGE
jgi:hypothetical protein